MSEDAPEYGGRSPKANLAEIRDIRSSIEVTRNAKGDYQWVIKRYFDQEDESASKDAKKEIDWIDARLRETYVS